MDKLPSRRGLSCLVYLSTFPLEILLHNDLLAVYDVESAYRVEHTAALQVVNIGLAVLDVSLERADASSLVVSPYQRCRSVGTLGNLDVRTERIDCSVGSLSSRKKYPMRALWSQ